MGDLVTTLLPVVVATGPKNASPHVLPTFDKTVHSRRFGKLQNNSTSSHTAEGRPCVTHDEKI